MVVVINVFLIQLAKYVKEFTNWWARDLITFSSRLAYENHVFMEKEGKEKETDAEKNEKGSYPVFCWSQGLVFLDNTTVTWPKYAPQSLKRSDISDFNLFFIRNWGFNFLHSLHDNLSLSPVLIFLKNKLLIKLFQTGEMWRICLQAHNQQHMNSIVRIKLHMLTSCLTHEDLKFGLWYKVSTWMTLWAIIKIPWNKGFSKVLIACSPGMCGPGYWDTDSGQLTVAGISPQHNVGWDTRILWNNWCFPAIGFSEGWLFCYI